MTKFKSQKNMQKLVKLSGFVTRIAISLLLVPILVSAQKDPIHYKEYLVPSAERYNCNRWVQVTQVTFYQFCDTVLGDTIERDSSTFQSNDKGFRIFIDHAGNSYYWIHPYLEPDTFWVSFSANENELAELLRQITFTIKYAYGSDTVFLDMPKYQAVKDTLVARGRTIQYDSAGNIVESFADDTFGETGLDIIIQSRDTQKEVLLRGESQQYGVLCRLVRNLMIYDNPREAVVRFLYQYGRGSELYNGSANKQYISSLLLDKVPNAFEKLPRYIPYKVYWDPGEITTTIVGEKTVTYKEEKKDKFK